MYQYRAYGIIIHSNIILDLPPAQTQLPDYTILVQDVSVSDVDVEWLHDFEIENGPPWFRLGRTGFDYILRFIGYADFIIDEKKRVISCSPSLKTQNNTIEHLLLDQVLPRVLSRKKHHVLHAGAVFCENGAIGFIGETGCGKSTMTAYLGTHGYSILTDDCLVMEYRQNQYWALPSYPAIRLNSDMAELLTNDNVRLSNVSEYSSKLRVNPAQGGYTHHNSPEALRALLIINESPGNDGVALERLSMRDAFSHLVQNTFRLDPTDKQSSIIEFNRLTGIVSSVPVYQLSYPLKQNSLSDVLQAMLDLLKNQ